MAAVVLGLLVSYAPIEDDDVLAALASQPQGLVEGGELAGAGNSCNRTPASASDRRT